MRALVLAAAALAWPSAGWAEEPQSEPVARVADVRTYAQALESVAQHLESGRLEDAHREALALSELEYGWSGEALRADGALLRDVRNAKTAETARAEALRVRRVLDAVEAASGLPPRPQAFPPIDVSSLAPKDQIEAGGTVKRVVVQSVSVPERIARALLGAWDAFAVAMNDLWDWIRRWLEKLLPRKARAHLPDGSTGPVAIAFVVGIALLLVVLSVRALRRRGVALPSSTSSGPLVSVRDDDPLSRESNEWERHAQELGAAGRWREAIRAWYHAVLVALLRGGLLHYQKGRTNWEYASRLAPELTWRPAFFDLTRLFDREWYGCRTSDAESHGACARGARGILEALRRPGGES